MSQTPKVLAALLAQLPDNTTGDITPEDVRDAVVSLFPSRGQIDLSATATTTFAATATYYKLAGTTALDDTLGEDGFSMPSSNELRCTKNVNQVVLYTANVEVSCGSNNKTFSMTFAKNGTAVDKFHISEKLSDSNSRYFFSLSALIPMSVNDTVSVYVRNDTDTTSLVTQNYTLSAVGFIR